MSRLAEWICTIDACERVTEFVRKYGKPFDPQSDKYGREPFASDVTAGKNSPIYNAHSYHTKVPYQGIQPFIDHYTNPGDLVLDPFCGSGMTGVAAIRLGRIPILIDLCPSATFIAYNYCAPVNAKKFQIEAKNLLNQIKDELDWLYETRCEKCGRKALIEYVIWSDEFLCPRCDNDFLLWDVAVTEDGLVGRHFRCPTCGKELRKDECKRTSSKPILVDYYCPKCGRRQSKFSEFDLTRLQEIESRWNRVENNAHLQNSNDGFWPLNEKNERVWVPSFRMPEGYNTQQPKVSHNITHVNDFYTPRNQWALGRTWEAIGEVKDERIRHALIWIFTSFNPSIVSKLTRYNFGKRGMGPLTGTLYVPSFTAERNVTSIWESKFSSISKVIRLMQSKSTFIVSTQSATCMSNIPSDSIDYVFTDPPFGGNLMYSELNFIWESWLGHFTDPKEEAIINKSQGKGITEYKLAMTRSFRETYRVLKPNRWMTLIFHNSDGEVWQAIQDGLSEAGFVVGMIGIFDKKQRSYKQVTSSGAVGYDVVVNCYKPKATIKNGIEGKTTTDAIVGFLADQLLKLPLAQMEERTARMLHSKTIGFFMLQNKPLRDLSFEDFQRILRKNFRDIDGHWYLPCQRPKMQGQRKLFGYISNEAEAIELLEELLRSPRKYGDIAPEFFKALGPQKLQKSLQDLLQESFVEDKGTWRNPTEEEKESLIRRLTDKTAREISYYLKGATEHTPTDDEICAWIEFCYNNGLYQEGSKLFNHVDEKAVSSEIFKRTRKVAEICKLKTWEGS